MAGFIAQCPFQSYSIQYESRMHGIIVKVIIDANMPTVTIAVTPIRRCLVQH
jgi:hypothetical protein